tara:strand:+ start:173 stop:415 length:243 start_codon:yes stop_codon:yes gene_type:complete
MLKNCPVCKKSFDCFSGSCWCDDFSRPPMDSDVCICRECLLAMAVSSARLAPRQGQRPALPFQRGGGLGFLKKKGANGSE